MTLTPLNVPALLSRFRLSPSKGLGQNFLIDEAALAEIVDAGLVTSEDTVLEIGPGLGSLTRHLATRASRVVAVELDRKMIPVLSETLKKFPNVEVIQGDVLDVDLSAALGENGYRVVANIPYYITSAVIRRLLELPARPRSIALTIQKEVAERVCAKSGDLSLLALSVRIYGEPSYVMTIGKDAFYPAPKVDSAVVRIDLFDEPLVAAERQDEFFRMIKAGFGQKRKTLRNSLSTGLRIDRAELERAFEGTGIDGMRRAETLSIAEWTLLQEALW